MSSSESALPTEPEVPNPSSSPPLIGRKRSHEQMVEREMMPKESTQQRGSRPQTPTQGRATQDTEQPPSGQPERKDADTQPLQMQNEEQAEEEFDPAEDLPEYSWESLEERYHTDMEICQKTQDEHMEEWTDLMTLFQVWAAAGHNQETDRSFKRLKTRMRHVQHSEDHFERTKNHYVNVVKAFESALQLLNSPSA